MNEDPTNDEIDERFRTFWGPGMISCNENTKKESLVFLLAIGGKLLFLSFDLFGQKERKDMS